MFATCKTATSKVVNHIVSTYIHNAPTCKSGCYCNTKYSNVHLSTYNWQRKK